MAECIVRDHKCRALRTAFEMKSKRGGQRPTIVSADATREPVGLGLIEIDHVHHGIIDESAPHPTSGVWLPFHLFEPRLWVLCGVGASEIRYDMDQSRV